MYKIALEHITHSYEDKEVLQDFSFSFEQEKITCLLGPSGCGKTTVLRLVAGLEKPSKGVVKINGTVVSENGTTLIPPHQRKIGFVFQDLALWPHFTVYDNIAFGLKENKEKNVKGKVAEWLDLFGISDKTRKYPHQLSGGQKQMVAIARSLAMQPEILLMDEPLANIDTHLKENILNHLSGIHQRQKFTMLYVTHDYREAINTGDRIIIMNAGKVEAAGSKEEISHSASEFVKSFIKT
ncbi:ABC transporter ATP-binding protein [Algoriphagus sp. AGSA1]|uniref:ABC transporter ATP-binding protein n=1 Tax=unclassified Algoriphagus TaxID=2641541 RepID=UPI0017860B26|nr:MULTISPECIES: ABC transporter ATP-binding protein [unclassified Algoriphagus]MCE7056233.1 ABC transporter ATP-binding protein [Algoriphagus sp. AGSA1]